MTLPDWRTAQVRGLARGRRHHWRAGEVPSGEPYHQSREIEGQGRQGTAATHRWDADHQSESGAPSGCVQLGRASWVLPATPFKRNTETVVKLSQEVSRRRRLEGDEGERLLAVCRPQLRPIVEAALETGCRRGELLSLQWWQVRGLKSTRPELNLPASKTKTTRDRVVPISSG